MRKLLIAAIVILSPLVMQAQSNDVGIFVSSASYSSSRIVDPESPGLDIDVEFERGTGFGVSYNRFWMPNISTEFAYSVLPSKARLTVNDGPDSFSGEIGDAEFKLMSGIVQWHFATSSRISPYIGAGIARIEGNIDVDDETGGTTSEDLGSETTWIANAGLAFGVTPRVSITLDAKYLPYQLDDQAESGAAPIDINVDPLIVSAGVHYRF